MFTLNIGQNIGTMTQGTWFWENLKTHFVLDQYKTIRWEDNNLTTGHIELYNHVDNPSFAQKLAQHIMVTVGKGSYTSSSE